MIEKKRTEIKKTTATMTNGSNSNDVFSRLTNPKSYTGTQSYRERQRVKPTTSSRRPSKLVPPSSGSRRSVNNSNAKVTSPATVDP